MQVRVADAPFDFGAEAADFAARQSASGAVVTFTGIVRDTEGGLQAMEIEHYPGMTEGQLRRFVGRACDRFALEVPDGLPEIPRALLEARDYP